MILIWDNGESYGDHAIYFVDILDYDQEDCLKLLKEYFSLRPNAYLVAKAHSMEWIEKNTINIDDLISFWSLKNRNIIYEIKSKTLKGFYKKWKKFEEDLLRRVQINGNKGHIERVTKRHNVEFKPLVKYCEKLEKAM